MSAFEDFRTKINTLHDDANTFRAVFLDRDDFNRFAFDLPKKIQVGDRVCITGYFSETIRQSLERITHHSQTKVRLLCPFLDIKKSRDKKNLTALKKLSKAGAEIRINDRCHARILVSYKPVSIGKGIEFRGFLLIGSFDFNTECIGRERYDAGIKTRNPDLVGSAVRFFEQVWMDSESEPLADFIDRTKK